MQSGNWSVSTATNQPHPTTVFVSRLGDTRRHSAAPFSLTAILPPIESPNFGEHGVSRSHVTLSRFQVSKDETILHKMGRKLTSFLPGHERNETARSLRIPMQTEIQVMQEGAYDEERDTNSKDYWRKLPPIECARNTKGNTVYGSGSTMSFASTSSSMGERRTKRKPTPIFIPDSSDALNTCIEQVYPNGILCQANKYSSHTMRGRSYSIPSANSERSFPDSPPSRYSNHYAPTSRTIKLPPPVPPRSPKRPVPPPKMTMVNVSNRATQISHARTQSLSTMVKALFGVGNGGRLQSKKAAVLVSRTSSLKRMKSKASISTSPTKTKFKSHYTVVKPGSRDNKVLTNRGQVNEGAILHEKKPTVRRKQTEDLQSFLPVMTPSS